MLKLKVNESIQDDVNRGVVRIDSKLMKEIGVNSGNIVEIKGERTTVAIADRSLPGDIGLNIIRMDGLIRRNARTSIGDVVEVAKAEIKESKKISVAAIKRDNLLIRVDAITLKRGLLGRAVLKGDLVALAGTRRRRPNMDDNRFFEEMFSMSMLESPMMGFGHLDIKFVVTDTTPKGPAFVTENTLVEFNPEPIELKEERAMDVSYEDVGGLNEEIKKIREMVELPLKHPEIFERLGIEAPKGVLLHGPPGTGKTLIAKAVANETNSNFTVINGPEIMSKFYGQSEENLRKKFEDAEKNAPSIIFIDEVDAIASKREEAKGEVERRVVAQLLAIMDGLKSRGKVVVIAATNIPNSLDPALRRPGRFDREIEIGVPGKEGRLNVLKIHTRNMPLFTRTMAVKEADIPKEYKDVVLGILESNSSKLPWSASNAEKRLTKYFKDNEDKPELKGKDTTEIRKFVKAVLNDMRVVQLNDLAQITHGFVGADISALAKEAAMIVLRRVLPDLKLDEGESIPAAVLEKLYLTHKDFTDALKVVRPSALREVLIEAPNVKWEDIGGLDAVKQGLQEAVEWPLQHPEVFTRLGVRPPRGILLYGAPGTGKTLLAKAVAKESEANFILVKGPEMLSKWVGESEKAIRKIFEKARQASPTIIFFDEIDAIAPRRGQSQDSHVTERVVNQLLTEMDGLNELGDIVIIAATNRPDILDTALMRPGRFDRIILCPVPDEETRKMVFEIHTKNMPLDKDVDIDKLVGMTDGYVGADIEAVCREAAIITLRDNIKAKTVGMKYFEKALDVVRPSASKEIQKTYEDLEHMFRRAKAKEMEQNRPSYYG
ncbi:MAG: CDC48 family AAA ATPase [Nanoarchaeota archaeon]|nr:CDC48 family AAA ATPase [Nanoarchaeota archaeon]